VNWIFRLKKNDNHIKHKLRQAEQTSTKIIHGRTNDDEMSAMQVIKQLVKRQFSALTFKFIAQTSLRLTWLLTIFNRHRMAARQETQKRRSMQCTALTGGTISHITHRNATLCQSCRLAL